jgi:HTH-type transcriptional regulator, competence development regulator
VSAPALGSVLRALREKRGLSLRELGQLAEVDHAYIHRLETGAKESPSEEVLSKLARALRAEKRETQILRYLADHPETDAGLAAHVLNDQDITFEEFAGAASMAFRGSGRPDYKKMVERVRRFLGEDNGHG